MIKYADTTLLSNFCVNVIESVKQTENVYKDDRFQIALSPAQANLYSLKQILLRLRISTEQRLQAELSDHFSSFY